MRFRQEEDIDERIIDAAAEWFVEFSTDEPDTAMRRAFDVWLRKSPEHVRSYLELFPVWDDTAGIHAQGEMSADALIRLARSDPGNLVSLPGQSFTRAQTRRRLRPWLLSATAASLLAAAVVGWLVMHGETYATDIGEQRMIVLDDGSSIELNARSKLGVHFNAQQRRIELLAGQAIFRVAPESARPFIVSSGKTQVRALGTQFDVYKRSDGTRITVLEGRVLVSSAQSAPKIKPTQTGEAPSTAEVEDLRPSTGIVLSAGDQVNATERSIEKAANSGLNAAVAWREHRLVFSGTTLSEVADEFNRYNERQIIIRNAENVPFDVSGAFSVTDLSSLLAFLRAQPNVFVEDGKREITITLKR